MSGKANGESRKERVGKAYDEALGQQTTQNGFAMGGSHPW